MSKSSYELLRNRKIIDVLIGDMELDIGSRKRNMPYLSGPRLCDICTEFGYSVSYSWGGGPSRWEYMDNLMSYMMGQNRMSDLLVYLFDLKQFQDSIDKDELDEIGLIHDKVISAVVNMINTILKFSRCELRFVNNRYIVCDSNTIHVIEAAAPKIINIPYVTGLNERTRDDLLNRNYDSAITKSRTLIEEVLIYILEDSGIQIESKGNINKLYVEVKRLLNMKQEKEYDRRINSMLSGLEKIIQSVTEMRNCNSDSHGVGSKRITVRKHEAELVINATTTFTTYLIRIYENFKNTRNDI